jgi:hypothetical protein
MRVRAAHRLLQLLSWDFDGWRVHVAHGHLVCGALLAVLGMTMGAAHVLELPAKLNYDAQTDAAINSTLYWQFPYIGGPVQMLAIVAGGWLAYRERLPCCFC